MDEKAAQDLIITEYYRARELHESFLGRTTGAKVLSHTLDELWRKISFNEPDDEVKRKAIQVGAMALRFLIDLFEE